jgi:hypothetical protein
MAVKDTFGTAAVRTIGVNAAIASLTSDIKKITFKTKAGLIAGGLVLQRQAQKLTPVDTSNLKASATTLWATKGGTSSPGFKGDDSVSMQEEHQSIIQHEKESLSKNIMLPEVEVLYTAAYAIYVHEDLEAKHKSGKAKFLDDAAAMFSGKILAAIKMEVKL